MTMQFSWLRRFAAMSILVMGACWATGGCRLSCESDGDNPVEEVVDEVGDEVEDVAEKIDDD